MIGNTLNAGFRKLYNLLWDSTASTFTQMYIAVSFILYKKTETKCFGKNTW